MLSPSTGAALPDCSPATCSRCTGAVEPVVDPRPGKQQATILRFLDPTKVFTPAVLVGPADERTGLMFVFRTFDYVSYAVLLNRTDPVRPSNYARTPSAACASAVSPMAAAPAAVHPLPMSVAASTPEAWATLSLKALPHQALVALLRAFGDPASVLAATRAQLGAVVPDAIAARVQQPVAPESLAATHEWLADPTHEIIAWDDPDYPRALLDLGHAPPALFFVGRRELLNRPALAIIGSRNATAQGSEDSRAFAQALSQAGLTIVSGLAIGIDAAAHQGAMAGEG